ncbi:CapA family protein [Marinicrinis sediminis]|uniref:CapA family protein n=1 Tax=Marinicrinis sediminis TaxID=1652465 RepID=A0ABW5RE50_9BACL
MSAQTIGRLGLLWVVCLALILFAGCDQEPNGNQDMKPAPAAPPSSQPDLLPPPDIQDPSAPDTRDLLTYSTEATLVAVGDIMMHSPQIPAGYNPATDTYNFDHFFAEIDDLLLQGDWVYGNLETPLAGKASGYAGYPRFNAPDELADALHKAGFDVLSTANNHSLDQGKHGVLQTLETLSERGLTAVGTYASSQAQQDIPILSRHDIHMAFLAYTYGTNGLPEPSGHAYLVNEIDRTQIQADLTRARAQGADLITIALHFGREYIREPSASQRELAAYCIAAGADIVLGSHPHVVQPYEQLTVQTPDGSTRSGFVIYSLGNFISNQGPAQKTAKYTDVGVVLKLSVRKTFPEQKIEITAVESIPTWVHQYRQNGKRQYRVLPIAKFQNAALDSRLTSQERELMSAYLDEMKTHVSSYQPAFDPISVTAPLSSWRAEAEATADGEAEKPASVIDDVYRP